MTAWQNKNNKFLNKHLLSSRLPSRELGKQKPNRWANRKVYVLNPSPECKLPKWCNNAPPLIQKLVQTSSRCLPVSFWNYIHSLHKVKNMRLGISSHRVRAIKVTLIHLVSTMNICSLKCITDMQTIAKNCGLTPSRVSRATKDMEETGLLLKNFKKSSNGKFRYVEIFISEKLLRVFGISDTELQHARLTYKKCCKAFNDFSFQRASNLIDSIKKSLLIFKSNRKDQNPKKNKTNDIASLVVKTLQDFGLIDRYFFTMN